MDLTCRLAPIVFAELYELLLTHHKSAVAQFLNDIGFDESWLRALIGDYRTLWDVDLQAMCHCRRPLAEGAPDGLDPPHAQFAQHMLAAIRVLDTSTLQANLRARIQTAYAAAPEFTGVLPDCGQPVLLAWGLGMRCDDLGSTYPSVPALQHPDGNIAAAYSGLVNFLARTSVLEGSDIERWPELSRSAVLWRVVGILDGFDESDEGPAKAAHKLTAASGSYLTGSQHRRYGAVWNDLVSIRDGLSHLHEADRYGSHDFNAAVAQSLDWTAIGDGALEGLTALMMIAIVDEVASSNPQVAVDLAHKISDGLQWVREVYGDPQGPVKVVIGPIRPRPGVTSQRHMAALIQVGGQIPAAGILGRLVHTPTLAGPLRSGPEATAPPRPVGNERLRLPCQRGLGRHGRREPCGEPPGVGEGRALPPLLEERAG